MPECASPCQVSTTGKGTEGSEPQYFHLSDGGDERAHCRSGHETSELPCVSAQRCWLREGTVTLFPFSWGWIVCKETLKRLLGVPIVAQRVKDPASIVYVRLWLRSLALLSELRIQCCLKLWRRSQMWLRSGVTCGCGVAWQLQLQFDPQPGNFHMPQVWP